MKKTFGYFLLALTVVACSNPDDMFRLKGKFKNFNQGELAVFNQMGRGSVDTIRLADGKFTYDLPLLQALPRPPSLLRSSSWNTLSRPPVSTFSISFS